MSSECNNIKLAIRNDKSKIVYAICKQCLITANHDVCVPIYGNDMNSCGDKQNANVSNVVYQKKHKPKAKKPKKLGSKERLASPKPSIPRTCLRWSLTGRIFDLKGKIIASNEFECQSDCSKGPWSCKLKTIRKESIQIESHKSSIEHPIVNDFVVINIHEEDVEPKQIILDPDDQPMWESAKTVTPTPNSSIVQIDVDGNFVINSTYMKMICKNKFDDYLRANPHDHIREFLAICDMFKYGETQSEAVKLMIFPYSLSDKAKTWFNELNEESITSWDQMRKVFINRFFLPSLFHRLLLEIRNFSQNVCESLTEAWLRLKNMLRKCHGHGLTKGAIIQIFYHGLDEPTQRILDITTGGIFLYKSPNQAFQFLEDKVLFEHYWPIKSKNEHHRKSVAFADGSDSNTDNSRFMEKLKVVDSQIISLNEELQDMREKYNELRKGNASKNDDTPMCERHEANFIR
ncbi:reverse transcriptase domain-containing protein [Tanacetum coccineum]